MDLPPPGTLLSIAQALGLSKVAVSNALRDKPGVSEGVRAKVKAEALRQGYRPDPISSEMMTLVRAKRHHDGARTIAFINAFEDPTWLTRIIGFQDFVTGARTRATEYGYQVEVFEARAKGMNCERLADILYARGIKGVLVGPRGELEPRLDFPFARFASVLIGEPEYGPSVHRVSNHHAHTCITVLRHLAEKGYRRIGLALMDSFEKNSGYNLLMGAKRSKLSSNRAVEVIAFPTARWNDADGEAWIRKERLDAVVSLSHWPVALVERMRTPDGGRLGFASLSVFPDQPYSGINQHTGEIGAAAMEMLRELLISGERGTVHRPRVLLIEGEWVEGETSPGPCTSAPRESETTAGRQASAKKPR